MTNTLHSLSYIDSLFPPLTGTQGLLGTLRILFIPWTPQHWPLGREHASTNIWITMDSCQWAKTGVRKDLLLAQSSGVNNSLQSYTCHRPPLRQSSKLSLGNKNGGDPHGEYIAKLRDMSEKRDKAIVQNLLTRNLAL